MPWTTPRLWLASPRDVVSGPRLNDIRNDVKYLASARAAHAIKTAAVDSFALLESWRYWLNLETTPQTSPAELFVTFTKQEDDTALFFQYAVQNKYATAGGKATYAVNINGVVWGGTVTNVDPLTFVYPWRKISTADWNLSVGMIKVAPLPAGTYTCYLMVKIAASAPAYELDTNCAGTLFCREHWDAVVA